VSLPEGSDLADLLRQVGTGFPLDALILVVNGRTAETCHILKNRDQVHLIPAIAGG
jgi:sulfur carrier protein ThiS